MQEDLIEPASIAPWQYHLHWRKWKAETCSQCCTAQQVKDQSERDIGLGAAHELQLHVTSPCLKLHFLDICMSTDTAC